jgi:ADP-dependent NAD(P)H-hydrate dehydratase / NAD(P)H-hydrate epimerase
MKLVTAAQMQQIDHTSIKERSIPGIDLMELAGRCIAMDVADHCDRGAIVILCGKGNNGGDGFVAAKYLAQAGWKVVIIYLSIPQQGDSKTAFETLPPEIECFPWDQVGNLTDYLSQFDAAIDALLGTGTNGRPRAPYDQIITALNEASIPVFSADIPSGLDPDRGTADLAVRAWRTITMGLPKVGMVTAQGPDYCGFVRVEKLTFPADLLAAKDSPYDSLTMTEAARLLPQRPRQGHKGTFGLLVVAAGHNTMPGAAMLAGLGALRGGCGLVRMAVPQVACQAAAYHLPEALLSPLFAKKNSLRALKNKEQWDTLLDRATAMAIGPGIGVSEKTNEFLNQALTHTKLPMVLDADALNLLAQDTALQKKLSNKHVLTPHPGEMARLLGITIQEVEDNRWESARQAASQFGCTVLLKGAGTIVADPEGRATHLGAGNTAWARGGAGDVLTGLIGSLLAQGSSPGDATRLGGFLHGMAADLYSRDQSPRGALTRDVTSYIPKAFRELENQS